MEIKYTKDGKKVVVIGNLNSQEKIVQEIFVSGDQEFPAGENFIVKSLFDAPAISWEKKEEEKTKASLARIKADYDRKYEELQKKERAIIPALREKLSYLSSVEKTIGVDSFKAISDFLLGNIKWIIIKGWKPELVSHEGLLDLISQKDDYGRFEGFKLLTLIGKTNGDFAWKLNKYRDGSGGNDEIMLFSDETKALEAFRTILEEDPEYSAIQVDILKKHSLPLNPDKLAAYKKKIKESKERQIAKHEKEIEDLRIEIEDLIKE